MIARVDKAWIFGNTVRATGADQFAGRLVADVRRDDSMIVVALHYPLPAWVERYLIAPLRGLPSVVLATSVSGTP